MRALRRLGTAIALLLAGVVAALGLVLSWAHVAIRGVEPELPSLEAILAAGAALPPERLPVRVSAVNTARQPMPREAVLDPHLDPEPGTPYVLAIPAFVLEWADGRGLLVDAGMERDAALDFGRLTERFGGAGPMQAGTPLAEVLAPALGRPWSLVLTHLHIDHTQGLAALCAARPAGAPPVRLLETREQATRSNYTTRAARQQVAEAEPGCLARETLDPAPLAPLPGLPGAFVIRAAGHTPGSQVLVAFVRQAGRTRPWLFSGDVVNHVAGIRHDVPKPASYRWLVTPEADGRLGRLRRLLRAAEEEGAVLVVSHDDAHLARLDLPGWRGDAAFAADSPAEPAGVFAGEGFR